MTATLTFLGGAGTVTGSKFLVRASDGSVMIDAGLFQGLKRLRLRNWESLDYPPTDLDAVVVTHAHLDHCGYLPALSRQGMTCPVLGTPATIDLAALVLRDSAKLAEEDAEYAARGGWSKHSPPRPLYDTADVERLLPRCRPVAFGEAVSLTGELTVTLHPAGHILGSAFVQLEVDGRTLVCSGDLGRATHPLLRPPATRPHADVVLIESTYGNRRHSSDPADQLGAALRRCLGRGGVAVIPAFAVDRTEVVLMTLRRLFASHQVPRVPVFADSPMALAALSVYRDGVARGDPDVRPGLAGIESAFDPGDLREAHSPEESKRLNDPPRPCIIVSASGMASGGRVVHHLKHLLPDPRNAVILVGFQAAGTRGRALLDGAPAIKMHGRYVPVRAEVVDIDGFSVHADSDGLVDWLTSAGSEPDVVYVVHGEPEASAALASRIRHELGWTAVVPRDGEIVRLAGHRT